MKQKHIPINGQSIFVQFYNSEYASHKPTIVFLHEALGSVAQWRDFPKIIGERTQCNVVAYDRLGHGLSDPMATPRDINYLHNEAWKILPSVLADLGIKKPVLWGHSDGGSIALLYAARFPTHGLITEAAHVCVEKITLEGIKKALTRKDFLIDRLTRFHGDKTAVLFDAWSNTWLDKSFEMWNIESHLESINCPSLVIQGENDAYGTAEQVNKIVEKIGKNAQKMMIPNCGHTPHNEVREFVLNNFLKLKLLFSHS